jgi:hypothetical protein
MHTNHFKYIGNPDLNVSALYALVYVAKLLLIMRQLLGLQLVYFFIDLQWLSDLVTNLYFISRYE